MDLDKLRRASDSDPENEAAKTKLVSQLLRCGLEKEARYTKLGIWHKWCAVQKFKMLGAQIDFYDEYIKLDPLPKFPPIEEMILSGHIQLDSQDMEKIETRAVKTYIGEVAYEILYTRYWLYCIEGEDGLELYHYKFHRDTTDFKEFFEARQGFVAYPNGDVDRAYNILSNKRADEPWVEEYEGFNL